MPITWEIIDEHNTQQNQAKKQKAKNIDCQMKIKEMSHEIEIEMNGGGESRQESKQRKKEWKSNFVRQ